MSLAQLVGVNEEVYRYSAKYPEQKVIPPKSILSCPFENPNYIFGLNIQTDGSVNICTCLDSEYIIGNAYTESFSEFLNSKNIELLCRRINERKEILKNTELLREYEYRRSSNAYRSLGNHYEHGKFASKCIFIVSFLLMLFFERGAYKIGIIKFGLLSLLTSGIVAGIFILFWCINYLFLYNVSFKFYRKNIVLAYSCLILMITLLLGSPTLYYIIYNKKFKSYNIEYYNSISNEVNNTIDYKDFENAFTKTESLYLPNILPIVDLVEAVKVKSIRKELYNNISTNFFNDMFIRVNNDMDYSNYNYLFHAYKNKDKYYKKISNKDYKKEIKERIDKIENEIDEKRHNYLLNELNIIDNLVNQNKYEEAKKLIENMEHLSKSKIVLSNEKKFIFFDSKISYKEYWENQKKELLDKINK